MAGNNKISFSIWFFRGIDGSKSGLRRVFDRWFLLHIVVGIALGVFIDTPLKDVSRVILLPLMGILIGLTFAWAGNAQGFIQTKEIIEVSKNKPGGYIDYVFVYQFSIFMVLLCTGFWAVVAFDFKEITWFDRPIHPKYLTVIQKISIKSFLFFILSFTIREAWSTIQGVHYFLIVKNKLYERDSKPPVKEEPEVVSETEKQGQHLQKGHEQNPQQNPNANPSKNKKRNKKRR